MNNEYVKRDWSTLKGSERVSWALAAFLGPILILAGAAMLFRWQPFADIADLAGASWIVFPLGVAAFAAGVLLFVPQASFWAGLVGIAVAVAGVALYGVAGDWALAWLPGVVLVGLVALSALRGPQLKEQVAHRRERRAATA